MAAPTIAVRPAASGRSRGQRLSKTFRDYGSLIGLLILLFVMFLPFLIIAALVARQIREPAAGRTRELLRSLPSHALEALQRFLP